MLTARAQRWSHTKTLAITALAGSGHVTFTAVLGLLFTLFGFALHERIGNWFPLIAGGALLLFGLFYLYRQMIGKVHGHSRVFGEDPRVHAAHHPLENDQDDPAQVTSIHVAPPPVSDRVAITSLLALLTFSPCESFVPFYVYGIRYGWIGFALLTAILFPRDCRRRGRVYIFWPACASMGDSKSQITSGVLYAISFDRLFEK